MTFRPMRRSRQTLSPEACIPILDRNTCGVLSLLGDDGYPYGVPLSYVYHDQALYFHCATQGHKMDAIARCDKASFCVVDQDRIVPEKFTTYFRSVIAFGRVRVLEEPQEILQAINALALKYAPQSSAESREKEIKGSLSHMAIIRFDILHLSGKEAIEMVRARQENP